MEASFFPTAAVVATALLVVTLAGRAKTRADTSALTRRLAGYRSRPPMGAVDFDALAELPAPVARYFRRVLTNGQGLISTLTMHQSGVLRTSTTTDRWLAFTAEHFVVPAAPGFVWDAKVAMPLRLHARVVDSYACGTGSGRVSLLSAFTVAAEAGVPALNEGALHRYLAEAVWFPTALLPQSGVVWAPIDQATALATLTDGETTVSLEFRFNEAAEVAGIYSPGRLGKFGREYERVPWEGRFRDYRTIGGMLVPRHGAVGWHVDDSLRLVWQGDVLDARYALGN